MIFRFLVFIRSYLNLILQSNIRSKKVFFCKHFEQKLNKNSKKKAPLKFGDRMVSKPSRDFNVSREEVKMALKDLNDKISCGFDDISNKLLKVCPDAIADLIVVLATEIFELNHWPKTFKIAKAIVLYKKGERSDPNNYRIIALLSCISKVIEKVIHNQIIRFFERNKLLYNRQAGYRVNNS